MQSTQCFAENYWDKNYLGGYEYLGRGENIRSDNRVYRLYMQEDGNLVLVNETYKRPIWASNTSGNPDAVLVLQDDGNLVIYKDNQRKKAIWATNTCGK